MYTVIVPKRIYEFNMNFMQYPEAHQWVFWELDLLNLTCLKPDMCISRKLHFKKSKGCIALIYKTYYQNSKLCSIGIWLTDWPVEQNRKFKNRLQKHVAAYWITKKAYIKWLVGKMDFKIVMQETSEKWSFWLILYTKWTRDPNVKTDV